MNGFLLIGAFLALFMLGFPVVLAIGSHVEIIKYDAWRREAQLPTKNRMFCSPRTANGR